MTANQTQGIGHQKYPTYMYCSTYLSPKLLSVSLYDQLAVFEIFGMLGFPLTPMLKFKSDTKLFIFWQIAKISITLHSPMTAVFII